MSRTTRDEKRDKEHQEQHRNIKHKGTTHKPTRPMGNRYRLRTVICHASSKCIPENTAPQNWTDNTVRCAVFSLLKEMSQSSLAKQCPLTQSAISNIANWKYDSKLSKEKCKEFGEWYAQFITQKEFKDGIEAVPKDSRLTFHPQHEIPTMRQWYTGCKAPTDDKLRFYAAELNKGHVRQERPKVTVAKLKIWWKNERQREKRNKDKKDSDKNSVRTCFDQPTANLNDEPSTSASLNSETQSFSHESLTSYLNL
ncbi:hypothetical protein FSP39_019898 [Pinctada imbricata]|uniref:CUTL domain-containing protein n=1 Tax=Pinctada imbricata TaxID=66713 RepID=A0AA89BZK4_PINIB|nr:hypothetical protein FSP39_019898 [Pinctada imbricata]